MPHGVRARWHHCAVSLRPLLLVAVFAAGLALPVVALSDTGEQAASSSGTTQESGQTLFRQTILADAATSSAVRRLLERGSGFIDPAPAFGDLTGDGKADAVVRVDTAGIAGAIAVYVLSTDGGGQNTKLRVAFRSQQLYRAVARIVDGSLSVIVPKYAKGEEPCCPARQTLRTYAWDAKAKAFRRTSSTEIAGPGAPAPQR